MKIKATDKFAELGPENSWQGLGRSAFKQLKAGLSVECDPPDHLMNDGYLEKATKTKEGK
jgi:hypothetical protein